MRGQHQLQVQACVDMDFAHEIIGIRDSLGVGNLLEVVDFVPSCLYGCRSESIVRLEDSALRSLPSQFGEITSTTFEDGAGFFSAEWRCVRLETKCITRMLTSRGKGRQPRGQRIQA